MNQLKDFKKIVDKTKIPNELEWVIKSSIRRIKMKKIIQRLALSAAAVMVLFTGIINISPSFAEVLSDVPLIGSMVKVMTIRMDIDENVEANIETPFIEGLDNKTLEIMLNEKYLSEATELYDTFMEEMGEIIDSGGHMGLDSGYIVQTDTDELLSIGRYYVETSGSSYTEFKYDTIDKINGLLITLPSLFKDDSYIDILSTYLIDTMKELQKNDENLSYWVGDAESDPFETIKINQSFYISQDNKLVITFDKYVVAPGYMGVQNFEIPTNLIENLLINNNYIK